MSGDTSSRIVALYPDADDLLLRLHHAGFQPSLVDADLLTTAGTRVDRFSAVCPGCGGELDLLHGICWPIAADLNLFGSELVMRCRGRRCSPAGVLRALRRAELASAR